MNKPHFLLRLFAVLLLSVTAFACSDAPATSTEDELAKAASIDTCEDGSAPACSVCNPAENLPWLRDIIASYKTSKSGSYSIIGQGTYENQTVFFVTGCCPTCQCISILVWNCEGEVINSDDYEAIKTTDITDQKVIWQGEHIQ